VGKEKRARAGSRNSPKLNAGFNKNIKKSGPLIIEDRGLNRVLLVLVLVLVLILV
jgi:hypothetical protein